MQRRSHILRLIADLLTAELLSFPPFTELGKTTTLRKQETIQTDTVSWLHLGEQQMRIYQSLPGSVVAIAPAHPGEHSYPTNGDGRVALRKFLQPE